MGSYLSRDGTNSVAEISSNDQIITCLSDHEVLSTKAGEIVAGASDDTEKLKEFFIEVLREGLFGGLDKIGKCVIVFLGVELVSLAGYFVYEAIQDAKHRKRSRKPNPGNEPKPNPGNEPPPE